jgi:hypothetical protein
METSGRNLITNVYLGSCRFSICRFKNKQGKTLSGCGKLGFGFCSDFN